MLMEGYWNQSRGEEQNNAIDRCRELWNEMDAVDCERENILRRDSALLESARSRRLDDIHNRTNQGPGASILLFSVKKLLLMRHKYRARLFKDKRTASGPTFFLLRQRSDSDQRSGVHRAYRCYHHHRSMACWLTAQTMAANDVRANFFGSSSRRSWQSRQNVSCRISNSRCEFQTKIKPGVSIVNTSNVEPT